MKEIQDSYSKAREKPEHVKLKRHRHEEKGLESQDGLGSVIGLPTNHCFETIADKTLMINADTHARLMGQNKDEIGDTC